MRLLIIVILLMNGGNTLGDCSYGDCPDTCDQDRGCKEEGMAYPDGSVWYRNCQAYLCNGTNFVPIPEYDPDCLQTTPAAKQTTLVPQDIQTTTSKPTTKVPPDMQISTAKPTTQVAPDIQTSTAKPTSQVPPDMQSSTAKPTTQVAPDIQTYTAKPTSQMPPDMQSSTAKPTTQVAPDIQTSTAKPTTQVPQDLQTSTAKPTTQVPPDMQTSTAKPTTQVPTNMQTTTTKPTTQVPISPDPELCKKGWMLIREEWYCLRSSHLSQLDAKQSCEADDLSLAIMDTYEDFEAVRQHLLSIDVYEDIWIGGSNTMISSPNIYTWDDGVAIDEKMYATNKPDSVSMLRCLFLLHTNDLYIHDAHCLGRKSFLCRANAPEKPCRDDFFYENGVCYHIGTITGDNEKNREYCEGKHSEMAMVTEFDKFSSLTLMLDRNAGGLMPDVMLDGKRDADTGFWKWRNNKTVHWRMWEQRIVFHDNNNCLKLVSSYDYQLSDASCSTKLKPLCTSKPSYLLPGHFEPGSRPSALRICPDGWTYMKGECLYISKDHLDDTTYSNAKRRCEAYHGQLVSFPRDLDGFENLKKYLEYESDLRPSYWTGASTVKKDVLYHWVWPNGVGVSQEFFKIYYPTSHTRQALALKKPNSFNGTPYDAINLHYGSKIGFICSKTVQERPCQDKFVYVGGMCYYTSKTMMTYEEANVEAQSMRASLATFEDVKQWEQVACYFQKLTNVIGYFFVHGNYNSSAGRYFWTSGDPVYWKLWTPRNTFRKGEECLALDENKGLTVLSSSCSSNRKFMSVALPTHYFGNDSSMMTPPDPSVCPSEWLTIDGRCTYISDSAHATPWSNAASSCRMYGGHLATFAMNDTEFESLRVHLVHADPAYPSHLWIGSKVTDQLIATWHNGISMTASPFVGGKPITIKPHSGLLLYRNQEYKGYFHNPDFGFGFICHHGTEGSPCPDDFVYINGLCYHIGANVMNNDESENYCQEKGSKLSNFEDLEHFDTFRNFIDRFSIVNDVRLGGERDTYTGFWHWRNNKTINWRMWHPKIVFHYNNNCLKLERNSGYQLSDVSCSAKLKPLCTAEPSYLLPGDSAPKSVTSTDEDCPIEWMKINRECLYISTNPLVDTTYSNAQRRCEAYHGQLVSFPRDLGGFENLKKYLENEGDLRPSYWTGASTVKKDLPYQWVWPNGVGVGQEFFKKYYPTSRTMQALALMKLNNFIGTPYDAVNLHYERKIGFICSREVPGNIGTSLIK